MLCRLLLGRRCLAIKPILLRGWPSRQRSYDGGTLRELDPVAVRIKDHGNSCNISERGGWETLPSAGCKCSVMNFVIFDDLEGDVPPSRSVPSGIERGVGSLLQDDQALASAKRRTAGYGLFHETERIDIEAAMRFEVADRKPDSNRIYSLLTPRYQPNSLH